MSGDRSPILLVAEGDTVVARAVEVLGGFPTESPWVLVGGLAVFLRLGSVHRWIHDIIDLVGLSLRLADVPCSPLYRSHIWRSISTSPSRRDRTIQPWIASPQMRFWTR